jgi:hypothetical protein
MLMANAPAMPVTANINQANMTAHAADAERVSTPIEMLTPTQPYMNRLHPHVDTAKLLVNVSLTSDPLPSA